MKDSFILNYFKVYVQMNPTMSSSLPGGLWCHRLWDAEKLCLARGGIGQELRRGGQSFCVSSPLLDYISSCIAIYSIAWWYVFSETSVISQVCITDPDLIEKSNLNRQFLFRPHHIQVNRCPLFNPFVSLVLHLSDLPFLFLCLNLGLSRQTQPNVGLHNLENI